MATYWHATRRDFTPSILAGGLLSFYPPNFAETKPGLIYLTRDGRDAFDVGRWLRHKYAEIGVDPPIDILRIDADLFVEHDENEGIDPRMPSRRDWFTTTQDIPPRAIKKVYPLESLFSVLPWNRSVMFCAFGTEQEARYVPKTDLPQRKPIPGARRLYRILEA